MVLDEGGIRFPASPQPASARTSWDGIARGRQLDPGMSDADSGPRTAYPGIEDILTRQLREAALDHEAFAMRLKPCDLPKCRATCCHDGAYLTDEEMAGIRDAVDAMEHKAETEVSQ